jgi:hypothetical protein
MIISFLVTRQLTSVLGFIKREMGMGNNTGKAEHFMKVNLKMINVMVMVV